jgi:hypothetical protein
MKYLVILIVVSLLLAFTGGSLIINGHLVLGGLSYAAGGLGLTAFALWVAVVSVNQDDAQYSHDQEGDADVR